MTPPALLAELEAHAASPPPVAAAGPGPLIGYLRRRLRLPVPLDFAEVCARTVEAAGGDADDLADLLDVHRRARADSERRAAAIRTQAARRSCSCADGGVDGERGRCARCWGWRP